MTMKAFVDPLEALVAAEQRTPAPVPHNQTELLAQHATKLIVAISKTKAITLATIRSYEWSQEALDTVWEAQQIVITDKDSQTRAWELVKGLKTERRAITTFYKDMRDGYNAVSSAVLDLDDRDATFVTEAESRLDKLLNDYDIAETARETATRVAQQAIEDEKARAQQAEAAAAVTRVAEQTTNPVLKDALIHEAAGIATAPVVARRALVTSNRAQVRGVGFGGWRYKGTIADTDKMQLVKDIIAGKVGIDAVLVNPAWVKSKVDQGKEETSKTYPYITVTKERSTRG